MNSKETIQAYFEAFGDKTGWEKFAAENIIFEGPMPAIKGKEEWIAMTNQFIVGVTNSSLDSIICEQEKVAITATYNMSLLTGDTHSLKTMEVYTVQEEKISHILISFDTASFNEFMAKMPQSAS